MSKSNKVADLNKSIIKKQFTNKFVSKKNNLNNKQKNSYDELKCPPDVQIC